MLVRLSQVTRAIASNPARRASYDTDTLLLALQYEAQNQYCNVKGNSAYFSEFALKALEQLVSEGHASLAAHKQELQQYSQLAIEDRQNLLPKLLTDLQQVRNLEGKPAQNITLAPSNGSSLAPNISSPLRRRLYHGRPVPAIVTAAQAAENSAMYEDILAKAQEWGRLQLQEGAEEALPAGVAQGSDAWHVMRDKRLTASSFSNALGFFNDGRSTLWAEKVGIIPKFAGNAATAHGTRQEPKALQVYQQLTGHVIEKQSFQVMQPTEQLGWLGASPDGLIAPLAADGTLQAGQILTPNEILTSDEQLPTLEQQAVLLEQHPEILEEMAQENARDLLLESVGSGVLAGNGEGVLEIKCPWNRGKVDTATPPVEPHMYYMPQVQGLLKVFDREWCNLFVYTQNGCSLFHITRQPEYWEACHEVLEEFWWNHVLPARMAVLEGARREHVYAFRPKETHALTSQLISQSKQMAKQAPRTQFLPRR